MKIVIAMLGRTAAGKTTTARALSRRIGNSLFIGESALKLALTDKDQKFTSSHLNESLRDFGYRAAVAVAEEAIRKDITPLIDASFHKVARRDWVFSLARRRRIDLLVFIYCCCSSDDETKKRIARRSSREGIDNAAGDYSVYKHISDNFEEITSAESGGIPTAVFYVDTFSQSVESVSWNTTADQDARIDELLALLEDGVGAFAEKEAQNRGQIQVFPNISRN